MKFKDEMIKPGMVIHCSRKEDAKTLIHYLTDFGYRRNHAGSEFGSDMYCRIVNSYTMDISYGWGNPSYREKFECDITEFSDLIEPEPRFKVGDRVRVREDLEKGNYYGGRCFNEEMGSYKGKTLEVEGASAGDYSLSGIANFWDWTDEMLEPVDDSPINSDTDSPMTAAEVLEWLRIYDETDEAEDIFDGYSNISEILKKFTTSEILQKITAYEAAKKAPKPVEVERVDVCRIIQIQDNDFKKCVYEEDLKDHTPFSDEPYISEQTESILKKYVSEHDGKYFATIARICRVKEGES